MTKDQGPRTNGHATTFVVRRSSFVGALETLI
jgi:hypothetical protein